jgi:sec-independent protein translocase protein TatA
MLEYLLNIIGSEWIIIIFIALILLLGTNRFPEAAKKIGKIVGEYKKAKDTVEKQMKDVTKENFEVSGPVKDERKKLEIMASHFGVDHESKTDDELKKIIDSKIGQPRKETQNKTQSKK